VLLTLCEIVDVKRRATGGSTGRFFVTFEEMCGTI